MAILHAAITPKIRDFIAAQRLFFVGTAPDDDGPVHIAPKGYDCFRFLDAKRVAYYDLPGGDNQSAFHVKQNGRLTLMWCGFEGRPWIVRLFLHARVIGRDDPEFAEVLHNWPEVDRRIVRQVFVGEIATIQTSCGLSVPQFQFVRDRSELRDWVTDIADAGGDPFLAADAY